MKLVIDGFTTKAQVEAFWIWYSGKGEEQSSEWFECRKFEGEIDVSAMYSNWDNAPRWVGEALHVEVELHE